MPTKPAGYGAGGKVPSGAKSSDGGGERHTSTRNGVAMGKKDGTGANKLFNTGKTEGVCYSHRKGS